MKLGKCSYNLFGGWKGLKEISEWDSENTLVQAYCAPEFHNNEEALKELRSFFPNSIIIGCSTSGEINGEQVFDKSISVGVIRFEKSSIKQFVSQVSGPTQSEWIGQSMGRELNAEDCKGILVLSNGLWINGSKLIEGIHSEIDYHQVTVAGGMAGDGNKFEKTWVWDGDQILEKGVIGVGIYGEEAHMSCGSRGGWDIFGPERTISKSEGNVVYEIDGRPALELYKEYLGDKASELPASGLLFPLQIRCNKNSEERLVRTLLAVSEEDQSMTFAGDVPPGYQAQLMRANFERVIDAASDAGELVLREGFAGPSLTMAVSCVGRRLVLGERTEEETESLVEAVGDDNIVGFYSYGELGASAVDRPCELHNQTMTVIRIGEAS